MGKPTPDDRPSRDPALREWRREKIDEEGVVAGYDEDHSPPADEQAEREEREENEANWNQYKQS